MSIRVFNVPSLKGEACVRTISSALRTVPGIVGVTVDIEAKQMCVDFDSALIKEVQVIKIVRDAGHQVE